MGEHNPAVEKAAEFKKQVLPCGLTVLVAERPQFTGVHAVYSTHFGSVDRAFAIDGKKVELPAGIAHFLEHKMFENEEGDAFSLYAKTGASANAFTGFDKTCYIFTASESKDEALDILLDFVSRPYFTAATVEKEQGIIGQEIKMYEDSPEWRLMFAIFACLYHNHPIRDDIAGTVESIATITPELLYQCAEAFYRPDNMVLAVCGSMTMEQVLQACSRLPGAAPRGRVERLCAAEPEEIVAPFAQLTMPIAEPMLCVGFKEKPFHNDPSLTAEDAARGEILMDLLCEILCGDTSPLYRRLYDQGLVEPGFGGEVLSGADYRCTLFSGDSRQPEEVRRLLVEEIDALRASGIPADRFEACKNLMYGGMVTDLENIDDMAGSLATGHFRGRTPAQELAALAAVTLADAEAALQSNFSTDKMAMVIVQPA